MPTTLFIQRDADADAARLQPAHLQFIASQVQDPDGRSRIVITASEQFSARPGANKTVTFEFLDQASRSLFETPPLPEPFVLAPGASVVLTVKENNGIRKRPATGAASTPFARTATGELDSRFAKEANFRFVDPQRSEDHDHSDMHWEC
ncbi:MAG: hypothetical protein SFV51_02500 [Bryobacteraceae bacterium]|nr:hypothetical protein [Bryobacteraceae bacterium]